MLFSRSDLKRLIIPLLLEQLLVVLIGSMDTMMVSSCGEASVSGVSLVDSFNLLLISIFSALATGGAVVSSQYLGKKDRDAAGVAAKMLFYVILMVSCVLMVLGLLLRDQLLTGLFGSIEPEVMQAAQTYFVLSALSYPFLAMYNASCALLRSMGNTKTTLKASIIMNVINVCGNALTIYGFGWGVFGAGLATLAARMTGAVVTQAALRDPNALIPCPRLLKLEWDRDKVGKILKVGVPNGFENGLFQAGKLFLLHLVSTFGTASIAANAVGNTMCTYQTLTGSAMGLALITVVGRCVGAREFQQARYYIKQIMLLVYGTMAVINIVMILACDYLVIPFNLSQEAANLTKQIILIHGVGSILIWPLAFSFPNALRAAGDTRFTMMTSVFSMVCFRVVFGYLLSLSFGMGMIGVWWAMQIDWIFRATMFVLRYRSGKWESKVLV